MADNWPQAQGPNYGTVPGGPEFVAKLHGADFLPISGTPAMRKRMSWFGILGVLALPIGVFVGVMWVNSFTLRSEHTALAVFLTVCGLLVGVICGARGASKRWHEARGPAVSHEPDWLFFLCAACLVAWIAAVILGASNYSANMANYYELKDLAVFRDVDPNDIPATKYMDAAAIYFKPGTEVSQSLSLGFKSSNTYCVAPIVSGNASDLPPASRDFWAVGIDCCVPMPPASFTCGGQTRDPTVHAALRWMDSSAREYFRLGISQAQAEYGYAARNPVLFTWAADPVAEIDRFASAGRHYFAVSCIAFAVIHAAVTSAVVYLYSSQLTGGKMSTMP